MKLNKQYLLAMMKAKDTPKPHQNKNEQSEGKGAIHLFTRSHWKIGAFHSWTHIHAWEHLISFSKMVSLPTPETTIQIVQCDVDTKDTTKGIDLSVATALTPKVDLSMLTFPNTGNCDSNCEWLEAVHDALHKYHGSWFTRFTK